jgi:hypothetical protein
MRSRCKHPAPGPIRLDYASLSSSSPHFAPCGHARSLSDGMRSGVRRLCFGIRLAIGLLRSYCRRCQVLYFLTGNGLDCRPREPWVPLSLNSAVSGHEQVPAPDRCARDDRNTEHHTTEAFELHFTFCDIVSHPVLQTPIGSASNLLMKVRATEWLRSVRSIRNDDQ